MARITLLLGIAAALSWLACCATCTMPAVSGSEWQCPTACQIGEPFRMELSARGGITPPREELFVFGAPPNADCRRYLAWRPAGICANGLVWRAELVAWPLDTGAFSGEILFYRPQKTAILLPGVAILPRVDATPQWTAPEAEHFWANAALWAALLFCAMPAAFALFRRKVSRLDEGLLRHLRREDNPAAPCVAFLLTRQKVARFAGTGLRPYAGLEAHCRRLL